MAAPNRLVSTPFISDDPGNNPGGIYLDGGAISSNGVGSMNVVSLGLAQSTAAAQAVATGTAAILIPANTSVVRVSAAASTTGATLPVGTRIGQMLAIIVTSAVANTITFAAAGTSFVAGGAAISLAGLSSHMFIWDNVGLLWYQVGPVAN